jgi:hypothetical protein
MLKNLPPPPEAPAGGEAFLRQLADYYRQLQDYHQQAAAAAAQQLAHLQCLLPSPGPVVFRTEVAAPVSEPPELAAPALDQEASQPALPPNPEVERPRTASWLEIKDILEAGRGKLLHLGFIVRQLYGRLPPEILGEQRKKVGRGKD